MSNEIKEICRRGGGENETRVLLLVTKVLGLVGTENEAKRKRTVAELHAKYRWNPANL